MCVGWAGWGVRFWVCVRVGFGDVVDVVACGLWKNLEQEAIKQGGSREGGRGGRGGREGSKAMCVAGMHRQLPPPPPHGPHLGHGHHDLVVGGLGLRGRQLARRLVGGFRGACACGVTRVWLCVRVRGCVCVCVCVLGGGVSGKDGSRGMMQSGKKDAAPAVRRRHLQRRTQRTRRRSLLITTNDHAPQRRPAAPACWRAGRRQQQRQQPPVRRGSAREGAGWVVLRAECMCVCVSE